jgi:hypothetical protein
MGLCVITTRTPVADIADHEGSSALRRDLEQLSSDAGAKLLRELGVKGDEAELRSASDEFSGHSLALTLLGSYLTDAYGGDIRRRKEVSEHLAHDARQGAHARKVMESYNSFREVEPLFLAVISGCNAGLFRKALHEVYIPRIQRGNACFAAKVLGARGALLLVLARFFEDLKSAGGLPNCIGSGGCFSRPLVRRKPKLRLRFREAISIAKQQKSISLEKRAEGTYAEYRRQKANASGGREFRLPLW